MNKTLRQLYLQLTTPNLGWSGKWGLFWLQVKKRIVKCGDEVSIPLRNGRLFLDPYHGPDMQVLKSIFLRDEYATDYRGRVVIDLGAHKGYFLAYAVNQGARAVIAYEPDAANWRAAEKTAGLLRNQGCRIETHQEAVAGQNGQIELHVTDQSWSHSVVKRTDRKILSTQTVATTALEKVIASAQSLAGSESPVILKMDIEGAECDAILNTSPETLASVDEMFLETHAYAACSKEQLIEYLGQAGLEPVSDRWATSDKSNVVVHLRNRRAER